MPKLHFTLETTGPMFLHGSETHGDPELRAASVRGQLRYWYRAIAGAANANPKLVWNEESKVFGSTGQASAVSVRTVTPAGLAPDKYPMLPHHAKSGKPTAKEMAISPDTRFDLIIQTRPGVLLDALFIRSLSTWLLLGGAGKRSRRCFGGVIVRSVRVTHPTFEPAPRLPRWWGQYPSTVDDFEQLVSSHLAATFKGLTWPTTNVPPFPVLDQNHSRVVVCKDSFGSAEEANESLFDLLKQPNYSHNTVFGYTQGGRRASPLIAQVRKFGDDYHLVLTAVRSGGGPKSMNWKLLSQFMKDAIVQWSGQSVWGTL